MGDERNDLPEGTDTIIDTEDTAALPSGEGTSDDTGATVIAETTIVTEKEIPAPSGNAERPVTGSGSAESGLAQRFRDGGERLSAQAGERARGLVSQGLERSAETLSNVSRLVGDTAPILGPQRRSVGVDNHRNFLCRCERQSVRGCHQPGNGSERLKLMRFFANAAFTAGQDSNLLTRIARGNPRPRTIAAYPRCRGADG